MENIWLGYNFFGGGDLGEGQCDRRAGSSGFSSEVGRVEGVFLLWRVSYYGQLHLRTQCSMSNNTSIALKIGHARHHILFVALSKYQGY